MNEMLRAEVIQAWAGVETAKRRFALAKVNRLAPQQAIEIFRAEAEAEQLRLSALKRTREAEYIEQQRHTKREFEEAETALAAAKRASVRAERELAEDSENTRLKQERAAAKAQREAEQEIFNEGRRKQKQTDREIKERYQQ